MPRDMIEVPADELAYEQALVRSRWITELRRQGDRQCIGDYDFSGKLVCALVLLGEIIEGPHFWLKSMLVDLDVLASLAGLSVEQAQTVRNMNDGSGGFRRHTFAEIAGFIDGLFQ